MNITVFLLAFNEDTPIPTRIVDVPEEEIVKICVESFQTLKPATAEHLLDLVFYYGQNDFQPQPVRSVSCGDVIKLPDGSLHKVLGVGFERLPKGTDLNSLPRGGRAAIC